MSFVDELNRKIAAEREKQNKLYAQIGEKYVELHKTDAEPAIKPLVDEFNSSDKVINDYKEQLAQIENQSRCPKCGAEVPDGFSFCGNCGTKVKDEEKHPVETETCPNCGTVVEKGRNFCTECGKPMKAAQPVRTESRTDYDLNGHKICSNCGSENEPDSVFCENCGVRLDADTGAKRCSKCGAELEPDSIFCTECGTKVQ